MLFARYSLTLPVKISFFMVPLLLSLLQKLLRALLTYSCCLFSYVNL